MSRGHALAGGLFVLSTAACEGLPILPKPAVDAADPRFEACAGTPDGGAVAAFALDHRGAWSEHFPAAEKHSMVNELRSFVVVFPDGYPGPVMVDVPQPRAGHADLCVWNGDAASAAAFLETHEGNEEQLVIPDIEITGLRP
jgi:hypothetical protein